MRIIRTIRLSQLGPAALVLVTLLSSAGCNAQMLGSSSSGKVTVLAAENMWGSIATQIGGEHAQVLSVISNPDTDPHAYEPGSQDARNVAAAQYVVVNGAGYDAWATRLLAANPVAGRIVLNVAQLAGRKDGDNPHLWYNPAVVTRVSTQIATDLSQLDPGDAAYFADRTKAFTETALQQYNSDRAAIRSTYQGVAVGATEDIVVDLAADLQLNLITPATYMRAVAEGDDPSAADKTTVDAQIAGHQIKVLLFNRQNATPDVQSVVDAAHRAGIPVVSVTETLSPAGADFETWQAAQLQALRNALAVASTGASP